MDAKQNKDETIEAMFKAGAHYAYSKSRRHPTAEPFIFGLKNRVEIFDLEKTKAALLKAKEFVKNLSESGKTVLFVGGKNEAKDAIKNAGERLALPYVAGRWIGGTLTNFSHIRSRVDKLLDMAEKRDRGEFAKYTKKERLLLDREIARLETLFRGLVPLSAVPAALFIIDAKRESSALAEAKKTGVPVVALQNSDCDFKAAEYPIPGNDSSLGSIRFFVEEIARSCEEGKSKIVVKTAAV